MGGRSIPPYARRRACFQTVTQVDREQGTEWHSVLRWSPRGLGVQVETRLGYAPSQQKPSTRSIRGD